MKLIAAVVGLMLCGACAAAQEIQFDSGATAKHGSRQRVELLDDAMTVEAGKPQDVELRFRVDPGVHINSHDPKDELLLPTTLKIAPGALQVLHEDFPAGTAFHLAIGEGETLSVYEGEFRVGLRVIAPRGASTLTGVLRYQACDAASCFPPRTLPVQVAVTAR